MATTFHEVQFPTDVSWDSASGPGFYTSIMESDAGIESRVSRWDQTRHTYNVAYGVRTPARLASVKTFYLARKGAAAGFRFQDALDYTSNPTDPSYRAAKGTKDQVIGTGDGATTQFQLKKIYTSGPTSYTRTIRKPVSGTLVVWVNGSLVSSGYSLDVTTGIITFTVAPTLGHLIEASFEFDVPVRFGADADRLLSARAEEFDNGSISSLTLNEDISADNGPASEYSFGGSYEVSISANTTMAMGLGRMWVVSATTASLHLRLPDPTNLPTGQALFTIHILGANSVAVKDFAGTTLVTLSTGQGVTVDLTEQTASSKVWIVS